MSENDLILKNPSPEGNYGVYCEPIGGGARNPQWISTKIMSYEEAVKEADWRNRANNQWNYYAKPIVD